MKRFYKYIRPIVEFFFEHDVRKRWRVKRYLHEHSISKLQLGSGKNLLQGWLNTEKSVFRCLFGAVYMDGRQGDRSVSRAG